METVNIQTARNNLNDLVDSVINYSKPVALINDKGESVVIISAGDWEAIQETLYLNSVPGMAQSILAEDEPIEEREIFDPDEEW